MNILNKLRNWLNADPAEEILRKIEEIEDRLSMHEYAAAEVVESAQGIQKEINALKAAIDGFDPIDRIDEALANIKFTASRKTKGR